MKIKRKYIILALGLILLGVLFFVLNNKLPIATGYAAKNMCSCVFIADREPSDVQNEDLNFSFVRFTSSELDYEKQTVTSTLFGLFKRQALYRPGFGCHLKFDSRGYQTQKINPLDCAGPTLAQLQFDSSDLVAFHFDKSWNLDAAKLAEAVNEAFRPQNDKQSKSRAVVILQQGNLLAEQYADGFDATTSQLGWSMTKSITNAITGILVREGKFSVDDPAPIEEWQVDDRRHITIRNLLQHNPGLEWEELYGNASDVTKMLFKMPGKAEYAISKPLAYPIGEKWIYSSGTSNILSHILMQQFDNINEYICFVKEQLFHPLGMDQVVMEADASGTIVGSSYSFATPMEWARFGQLYLQDGIWNGKRILPEGWVAFTQQIAHGSDGVFGAHFWLNASKFYPSAPTDMFSANGFQGQRIFILPSHDLVIVRLGLSENFDFDGFLKDVLECFSRR